MTDDKRQLLIALYASLAAHTEPECATACRRPLSCCEAMYCELAVDFAQRYWRVDLQPGWHPALPLMGTDGCTAAPHLRPICTAHTCDVCEHGAKPGDEAWTKRYRELRDAIEELELDLFGCAFV